MKRKHYKGYRSYGYLEVGTGYREFKLAREIGRVPYRDVGVTHAQEARVRRLFQENLVLSLHDHCFVVPADLGDLNEYRRQGRDMTGYAGMARSGLDCVFDALMDGTATITSNAGWKWDDVLYDLGMRLCDIAHQDMVVLGATPEDIGGPRRTARSPSSPGWRRPRRSRTRWTASTSSTASASARSGIAYSEANTLGAVSGRRVTAA